MAGGTWDPTSLPVRPGLYINFENAALANIAGGARGIVAIPIFNYVGGTAEAGKFYTIEDVADASDIFGSANATPIKRVLEGGAKEVLAYAVPALAGDETSVEQYEDIRDAFEAREFNVFVYPTDVDALEQTSTKAWVARNRTEGKHFMYVTGGTSVEDANPEAGNARSIILKDEYIVNLITGVVLADGSELQSADYAPYIAGLIAGTPINKSITYQELPLAGVTRSLKNSEIKTALISGSLVIVKDGNRVIIEQGITTNSDLTERGKVRKTRARQAIATDIPRTARERYIGKIDNNPAGQAALISAIKLYLETMETNNVLLEPAVALDPLRKSVGDSVFLQVAYTEVDSMERIFLTIIV